jgi:general secretion pathway protein A
LYKNFFGFRLNPFQLTPDPNFLYLSHDLKEIIATLEYGIIQRRGFLLMVGEPGTGKTTLINSLIDKSDTNANFAYILNPSLNFDEMLHMILVDFDLASANEKPLKTKDIHRLKTFVIEQFKKDRNTVIIVDEAQSLDIKTLENLRLLSNIETREHKLIQIIIAGQPELEHTLSQKSLKQLAQRIGLRCRTKPFDQRDTFEYIEHRLKTAGYDGPQLFGNKAKHLVWTYSKGIPRTINIVCETALITGYAVNQKRIDALIVKEVIDDLNKVPLNTVEVRPTVSENKIQAASQEPIAGIVKSDQMGDSAPELPGKKDEEATDVVGQIRKKIIQRKELEPFEKKEKRHTAAWIAAIAAIAVIINIALFYFFTGSFKNFKNEVALKFDTMKDNVQNELSTMKKEIADTPAKTDPQTFDTADDNLAKTQADIALPADPQPDIDNSSLASSADAENVEVKNAIVVKRGETLGELIRRYYGKEDPIILDAVLKLNPDITNPNPNLIIFRKPDYQPSRSGAVISSKRYHHRERERAQRGDED